MDDKDAISEFLGTENGIERSIVPAKNNEIMEHSDDITTNAEEDYRLARESMKEMISTGTNIIDSLAKVAEESESPRAYEVLATTLKTITEMNKSLMDLHKDTKDIMGKSQQQADTINNTQYVFNGTVADLQKALSKNDSE